MDLALTKGHEVLLKCVLEDVDPKLGLGQYGFLAVPIAYEREVRRRRRWGLRMCHRTVVVGGGVASFVSLVGFRKGEWIGHANFLGAWRRVCGFGLVWFGCASL